jgi:hypothetical protein
VFLGGGTLFCPALSSDLTLGALKAAYINRFICLKSMHKLRFGLSGKDRNEVMLGLTVKSY